MRLICPNCGAQYEVPDSVIPEGGRDVQCSNCGQTWLAGTEAAPPAAARRIVPPPPPAPERPRPQPSAVADAPAAPEPVAAAPEVYDDEDMPAEDLPIPEDGVPDDGDLYADDLAEDDLSDDVPPIPEEELPIRKEPRREIDPEVARILREEAERESRVRAEATRQSTEETFGGQVDLDLADPEPAREVSYDPDLDIDHDPDHGLDEADPYGDEDDDEDRTMLPPSRRPFPVETGRRELLPDVEEINSSLRPDEPEAEETAAEREERRGRSGFRLGFSLVLLVAAVLALAYAYAAPLGARFPALAPALTDYANAVDDGRLWLDLQLQGLLSDEP